MKFILKFRAKMNLWPKKVPTVTHHLKSQFKKLDTSLRSRGSFWARLTWPWRPGGGPVAPPPRSGRWWWPARRTCAPGSSGRTTGCSTFSWARWRRCSSWPTCWWAPGSTWTRWSRCCGGPLRRWLASLASTCLCRW